MDFDGIPELTKAINLSLSQFFEAESGYLQSVGEELYPVADALGHFLLDSGKRLRPLFAAIGYLGTGSALTPEVIRAAASLELVHVCALIHDDVMDDSDTRRGAPAIHKQFESLHSEKSLHGSAPQFGVAASILMGDLALIWAAKALHEAGIPSSQLLKTLPIYDQMRVELMAGQYLDVYEQALASESVERSLKVATYKSGRYSIERPLHFGASLSAICEPIHLETYSHYGLPLGQAFQLRDDVIGVFGDPEVTGKPAGDDLREGKRTVLAALTLNKSNETQRSEFNKLFGRKDLAHNDISTLRQIIIDTGALADLEQIIADKTAEALTAIETSQIDQAAASMLNTMAIAATQRSS